MALQAKAEPGTHVILGNDVFDFGDDGTRQVTQNEADELRRAGVKATVEEVKTSRKEKS